jgi:nucleotide-binding universal stress UspA family protein
VATEEIFMTSTHPHDGVPHHLVLATDLSARCDRALDRAAQLAQEWQAELVALNVLDPAATPDQALAWISGASDDQLLSMARQQLARDIATAQVPATLRLVRSTDPCAAIRETAAATKSGVVVTGVCRNEALGRLLLGSTVENLARSLPQPLLVVRHRTQGPYERIVVATDFSESSRQALLTTAQLFPGRELILYHAHALVAPALTDASEHPQLCLGIEQTEAASFLASTTLPEGAHVRAVVACGAVELTLTRYVREHDIDLVVMGSHGRSGLMSLLLGSTAARLLDWLPCDTLLVRPPDAVV